MKRWKKWELTLLLGLCAALIWGAWSAQRQDALARKMIRLHVIANSDSAEDQALKPYRMNRRLREQARSHRLYERHGMRSYRSEIKNPPALHRGILAEQMSQSDRSTRRSEPALLQKCAHSHHALLKPRYHFRQTGAKPVKTDSIQT